MQQDFKDLLDKAGLPDFQPKMCPNMSIHEFFNLSTTLAPNESDGPDDSEVWNLFENYLTARDPASLNDRHDLSKMLTSWAADTASIPGVTFGYIFAFRTDRYSSGLPG
jgi:hypothetical protein